MKTYGAKVSTKCFQFPHNKMLFLRKEYQHSRRLTSSKKSKSDEDHIPGRNESQIKKISCRTLTYA